LLPKIKSGSTFFQALLSPGQKVLNFGQLGGKELPIAGRGCLFDLGRRMS